MAASIFRNEQEAVAVFWRLLSKADRMTNTGCLEWRGASKGNGYGHVNLRGRNFPAHRLLFFSTGQDPTGLDVCHRCDNRGCIAPWHLFSGTRLDNMRDAVSKGRQAKGFSLPHTKLSGADVREIVSRAISGEKYASIAADFGISRHHAGGLAIQYGVRRRGK